MSIEVRWRFLAMSFGLILLLFADSAHAVEIAKDCSVAAGFDYDAANRECVGFVKRLSIGGTDLSADLLVTDPRDADSQLGVVGVVDSLAWDGGLVDPLSFVFQVSSPNQHELVLMVARGPPYGEVRIIFEVFDYDPAAARFFPSFHSDDVWLKSVIQPDGSSCLLDVETEAGPVYPPVNFAVLLALSPCSSSVQELHLAASVSGKQVVPWGTGNLADCETELCPEAGAPLLAFSALAALGVLARRRSLVDTQLATAPGE